MNFRQFFDKYFNSHSESREKHWDEKLQTRYYKANKSQTVDAVAAMFKKEKQYEVTSIQKERGEIGATIRGGKKAFVVVTIIEVRPYKTAVDFSVTSSTVLPFDFGSSHKKITRLYDQLDKTLTFIGTGLSNG
ncbi:cytosolic protein [Litoribacterium kuwaitense]|uniref:cytosolic protein n=1 Tax=Litoribacterium kuwaitense TaxID=1398745 RepID=UPI001FE750CB|nr:cytosolic protein [Litoribacterium kuwaitense]